MHPSLTTHDQLLLKMRVWPGPAAALGAVVLVHGLGEHAGRYAPVAERLNQAGWAVIGYDLRGHGESQGERGDIAHSDSLLRDLATVIDAVRADHLGPLVLLGHSMGGLIAARFVAEALQSQPAPWARPVDALVLSSPALALGLNPIERLLLAVLPRFLPHLRVSNGLSPAWISREAAVVQSYRSDPLVHDRISGRLAQFMGHSAPVVFAAATRWNTPTLLMWAGADRCVAPHGSERLAQAAPTEVLTARAWPELYHEIFHEPEKARVLQTLTDWLAEFVRRRR